MKEVKLYELISENLTCVGGPMGSERTWQNFRKIFSSLEEAKKHAEKDYENSLDWIKTKEGYRTQDLGHVMYEINILKAE